MDMLTIILKNIWHKKIRTILTILGISVSISAYVALIGLTNGLEDSIKITYAERGTDLIVLEKGVVDILSSNVDGSYVQKIKAIPDIKEAAPILLNLYSLSSKTYILLYGWDFNSYLCRELKVDGRIPSADNEVILGQLAAQRLGKKNGDEVAFKGQKFIVAGIFQSKSLLENGAVVMSIKKLQEIKGVPGKITALNLKVRLSDASEETPEKLEARIEAARLKIEKLFPELEAKNVQAFMTTNTPLFLVKNFTWAISLVAFLIVVLGILNTMTMSVLERTREIGILRAMGWRTFRILLLVLVEAGILGALGGAGGIFLGYGLMNFLVATPQLHGFMGVAYDKVLISQVAVSSLLLGIGSGIYPAIKAVSIDPIKVLRHE